ncbi:MAG TPA: hypothetical protein VIB38_11320 [Aestuariivirgaceae bacterium]
MTKKPPPAPPEGGDRTEQNRKRSWHESLPFPRHWLAYLIIKLAVVCLAIYLVLRYLGPV